MSALAVAVVLPGLAIGSFLNVIAARVPLRRSISHPPSACLTCDAPIAARDNIPVLSYLLLHGRCRNCRTPISPLYPAVEVLTAVLVAVCVLDFGATQYAALAAFFCITLVTLSAADLRYRLVPNRIVLPAFVVCVIARTAIDPGVEWIAAAAAAAAFMLLFAMIYPAGLGMGDVKLTLFLGAMLGRSVAAALLIGFVSALLPSIVLFARHGSKARKMAIPLVPFLAFGAVMALFFGDQIIDWYTGLGS
jgi:leader peptidase (prepilin peptidase)/N-methyltransferase